MNTSAAISAYNNAGLKTTVMSADPHKLTAMLYEGALLAIARAREETLTKQTAAKGQSISKAIAIVGEGLNASLDRKAGGKLADDLSALYTYMVKRLVDANLNSDVTALDEVAGLLRELKDAWDAIRPQALDAMRSGNAGGAGNRR